MPEFPITIAEHLNTYGYTDRYTNEETRWGWKLTYQSEEVLQVSIHRMDSRPGHERLIRSAADHLNMSIARIMHEGAYNYWESVFRREFYDNHVGLYVRRSQIVALDDFITDWDAFISDNERVNECDECGQPELTALPHTAHEGCVVCEATRQTSTMTMYEVIDDMGFGNYEVVNMHLCMECQEDEGIYSAGVGTCGNCGCYATDEARVTLPFEDLGEATICSRCEADAEWCQSYEHWVPSERMYDIDDEMCRRCHENQNNPQRWIQEWNYRPPLDFFPEVPTDPARPLYIGLELEMSWPGWQGNYREEANDWLTSLSYSHKMLYVKSDSSVSDGFEVVTHPMEPKWALENFPFDFFNTAIEMGAAPTHSSCGTHIHINKAALTTAQMYKLIQLHLKLKNFCGIVGGRGTNNEFASWEANDTIAANLKEIARKKGEAFGDGRRYVPVNVRNEETLELRYMAGSIEPETIRKNIEWVQALFDFTDYISIQDVKEGVLNDQGYLLGWALNGNYPSLAKYLTSRAMVPQTMPVRSI